ncbi:hypothetical protein [Burkholderia stagnalis]|nr:hypothetical protein [Burkholderia stagnalis]
MKITFAKLCYAFTSLILSVAVSSAHSEKRQIHPRILSTAEIQSNLQGKCAIDIPSGFDWPANSEDLYRISGGIHTATLNVPGVIDVAAQRKHGWNLFAGITQPSGQSPSSPPVFETWYTVEEAFDAADGKVQCSTRKPSFRISLPTQLLMTLNSSLRGVLSSKGITPSPRFDINPSNISPFNAPQDDSGDNTEPVAFSHVAFNQEMYDYIRDNKYYSKKTLDQNIDQNVALKKLVDPPIRGISLKFAWWPVDPSKLTPLPVWDSDPRFPGDAPNPPTTWKRIVLVDPIGGLTPPATVQFSGFEYENPKTVPIDRFYAIRLSTLDAAVANADFRIQKAAQAVLGRNLQGGDFLLLTAMHIATREFDPWVWLTYWWTDKPGIGELASDMPSNVKGVWRNYVMDVSFNINNPKGATGKAPIAFNPWLELFQKGGTRSQCMACHARAAYGPGVVASFNPTDMSTSDKNGFDATPTDINDPNFKNGTLSLHRIWTIMTRSQ